MEDNTENLRIEYPEVCANWRFLVDVRFKILGFFFTLITGLGIAFTYSENDTVKGVIFIGGFVSIFSIYILELRNRTLYRTILRRGVYLESLLKIADGQFQGLNQSWKKDNKKGFLLTQSHVIDTLFITLAIIWLDILVVPKVGDRYQLYVLFISLIAILIIASFIFRKIQND